METRCAALQQRVDGFLEEMANSEHADLLLTHVDKLEKDRMSLETVLELKNQELTQLRTKMNEQVFQVTPDPSTFVELLVSVCLARRSNGPTKTDRHG